MTTTRDGIPARTHVIIGDQDEVIAALHRAHAERRLLRISDVSELPGRRVQLTALLIDPPPQVPRGHRLRKFLSVIAALAMIAATTAVLWLTLQAIITVVAGVITIATWIGSHILLICIAVAIARAMLR